VAWLKSSRGLEDGDDGPVGMTSSTDTVRDNKIHGVVDGGGRPSRGYREVLCPQRHPAGRQG
jgi:hypothetical protein